MAMTPYSGDTSIIGKLGTTPQERGLTTQQFKDKFDEGLKNFVTWFNATHKGEIESLESKIAAVYNNANQSIPNTTLTPLAWNVAVINDDSMFSAANNTVLTCKTVGIYLIIAIVRFEQNATGYRRVLITKNSLPAPISEVTQNAVNGFQTILNAIGLTSLEVNDTVQVEVYQTSGEPLNVMPQYTPQFIAIKVG